MEAFSEFQQAKQPAYRLKSPINQILWQSQSSMLIIFTLNMIITKLSTRPKKTMIKTLIQKTLKILMKRKKIKTKTSSKPKTSITLNSSEGLSGSSPSLAMTIEVPMLLEASLADMQVINNNRFQMMKSAKK